MRWVTTALTVAAWLLAGPAGGVDTGAYDRPVLDGRFELKWDTGTKSYHGAFRDAGVWVGNDFDVTTVKARMIEKVRVYSGPEWPNGKWDGFRLGVYGFARYPGLLIWPTSGKPLQVRGKTTTYAWNDFDVGWILPAGFSGFVAAIEQTQAYPNNDPFCVDDNPTALGHSWQKSRPWWDPLSGFGPYKNLMIRVVVATVPGVEPVSLGRVKALYW
jgi:hypothetical protein